MVQSGAFDCFKGIHRAQYFALDSKDAISGIEKASRFGNAMTSQVKKAQTLFGDLVNEDITTPTLPVVEPWSKLEALRREKDVIGFYVSGHPLDDYQIILKRFCNTTIEKVVNELDKLRNRDLSFAGIIASVTDRISKNGKPFGSFVIEDLTGSMQITMFGEEYGKFKPLLVPESLIFIKGKVNSRFNNPNDLEFRPSEIQYLSDVGDKMTRQMVLQMNIWDVKNDNIALLNDLLSANQGTIPVKLQVIDDECKWSIPFSFKNTRVKFSQKFVSELQSVTNRDVIIN